VANRVEKETSVKNRLLMTLLIIGLLVVYYLISMDYRKQHQQQAELISQIDDATLVLDQMPGFPDDLEPRLASARADLSTEQGTLLKKINSTRAINTILQLADECGVKAIPVVTEPWSSVKVGEHDYRVFRLSVSVEGSFSNLVSFTDNLENGGLETLVVDNLSVTRTIGQFGEGSAAWGNMPVTARLHLSIYTRPLSVD
jgi:hypothetical protein